MVRPFKTRPVSVGKGKTPGVCIVCSQPATTEAFFQLEDAVILQRYCDKHISGADYVAGKI